MLFIAYDIFLKSAERQGESGHDVRVSRSVTSRRDVPFAVGVRGVYGNPTLRAMHSQNKNSDL